MQQITAVRQRKINSMSDREKRANAAEARIRPTKCVTCDTVIASVPFERLTYKYCCIECVKEHKKKLSK